MRFRDRAKKFFSFRGRLGRKKEQTAETAKTEKILAPAHKPIPKPVHGPLVTKALSKGPELLKIRRELKVTLDNITMKHAMREKGKDPPEIAQLEQRVMELSEKLFGEKHTRNDIPNIVTLDEAICAAANPKFFAHLVNNFANNVLPRSGQIAETRTAVIDIINSSKRVYELREEHGKAKELETILERISRQKKH